MICIKKGRTKLKAFDNHVTVEGQYQKQGQTASILIMPTDYIKICPKTRETVMKPRKLQKLGQLKFFEDIPIPKATCWWTCSIRLLRPRQPQQWRRLQGWVGWWRRSTSMCLLPTEGLQSEVNDKDWELEYWMSSEEITIRTSVKPHRIMVIFSFKHRYTLKWRPNWCIRGVRMLHIPSTRQPLGRRRRRTCWMLQGARIQQRPT